MVKWSISIFLILLVLPLVVGLEECKGVVEPEDIPCRITSTWAYDNCSNNSVTIYADNGSLVETKILGKYGETALCNFTFNYTSKGTYTYNVSSGDTGVVIVEVKMITIAMIIGLSCIAFLFLYFSFNLDNEHFLLKILLIFFSLYAVILIPATIINGVDITKNSFLNLPLWLFRLFVIYFAVFLFWHWIQKSEKMLGIINNVKGVFKK